MKYFIFLLFTFVLLLSCKDEKAKTTRVIEEKPVPVINKKFGYVLDDYKVVEDTVHNGDSFGEILYKNHIEYPEVYKIVESVKDSFEVRKILTGKPYTILAKKDTTEKAQVFIYEPGKTEYVIVDFTDSVFVKTVKKKIRTTTRVAEGKITSSLSEAMDEQGLDYALVNEMSDIYAWTIDFFHLQKDDKFKVIFEENYVDDTLYVGLGKVKAAFFEHKKDTFYAFNYVTDSLKNISDYYDENANSLRRQFLKAPIKFSRISSRYNLNRFIRYYGRVKAHRGTDFAAPVGTPIMSTANGTVIESRYKGGNGNYVKVKHNSVYSTQYLHMKKRAVKVGDFVKQGDVIGWVGMTGYTSGPHVCYRFWKNGREVDPFREKLPSAEPIKDTLKAGYLKYITPLKEQLDQTQ
ncbi:MAG: peptidoglycan DD-metalloendopeptidase family protein [Flavobacteriaceae bacterium]|nr:peptidoglycan DD-metalloendopeptidase family protein [Flavobacteriaceae bacterium]